MISKDSSGEFDIQKLIADECDYIKEFLLEKNKSYGNSSIDPIGIFASDNPFRNINARIDDKLSRKARGGDYGTEDLAELERDMIGYLLIKRVARHLNKSNYYKKIHAEE